MEIEMNGTGISAMNVNEQLELLRSILESSTEYSIMAMDLHGTILAWNAGAKRIYGYSASEVIGHESSFLHDPNDIKSGKVKEIFETARQTGTWSGELQRVRKDGRCFSAYTTITLRKDSNNTPIGFILISRDITEFQNAIRFLNILETSEELLRIQNRELAKTTLEAQESNRLKSEFLANVSHELRTPLNAIIGFAELIYDGMVDPASPKCKEFLEDIISSANHLVVLINDVLDLAKIESGKMDFHPEKIDLTKLSVKIKNTFQTLLMEKKIKFKVEIDPNP